MDRFSLARHMGHSSPSVAAKYYVHVTETHVAAGFGKFVEYQTRNVAEGLKELLLHFQRQATPSLFAAGYVPTMFPSPSMTVSVPFPLLNTRLLRPNASHKLTGLPLT